jgi:hypothetical protein
LRKVKLFPAHFNQTLNREILSVLPSDCAALNMSVAEMSAILQFVEND